MKTNQQLPRFSLIPPLFILFFFLSNCSLSGSQPSENSEQDFVLTTSIHMISPLPQNEMLIVFEEGSVWIEEYLVTKEWEAGDTVEATISYDASENEYLVNNLTKDSCCRLIRLGKTTKTHHKISTIEPYEEILGANSVLTLENYGAWLLVYDQDDLNTDNTAIGWNAGERVLLIVDPDEDWNQYPNDQGIFKYWWDYYFFNLDLNHMIDPVAIPRGLGLERGYY